MKNLVQTSIWITFCLLLFNACANNSQSAPATDNAAKEVEATPTDAADAVDQTVPSEKPIEVVQPIQAKELLYAWVDKLNIRKDPNTKGTVVTTVSNKEALEYTGDQSDQKETIVLRGLVFEEPWYKVRTKDRVEGWVFGGAVKRDGETKGGDLIDDQQFNFPHFGSYDLKDWKRLETKDESGGDAEINIMAFQKGNQILEITKTEVGEYGYSNTYKLQDANKKLLKIRVLDFSADPELLLTEKVVDYTVNPAKTYQRSQKMKKHFMQLNSWPLVVNGAWD